MTVYLYDQIDRSQIFTWNICDEMRWLTGLMPWTSDVATGDGIKTQFTFERDLTPQEKSILDGLVTSGSNYPTTQAVETVFEIDDLWDMFSEIMTRMGLDPARCRLRFGDMNAEGKTTKIRLIYSGVLTKQEKSQVIATYGNMIREL